MTYDGHTTTVDDPYRFLPTVQELDRHLVREGRHEQLWTVLGANVRTYPGELGEVSGTSFAVWAPNARAVRVVGDFNYWQGASHAMRSLGDSGVWEVFAPGVGAGARYKFEVLGSDGSWRQKADPLAQGTEVPPATASVVVESRYRWTDDAWLDRPRRPRPAHRAHERLRGPPRLLARRAVLPGPRPPADRARRLASASRTSSCCPSPSTPSAARGATRCRRTSPRPPGSATPTTSATSSTPCTRPASASSSTGSPPTSPRTSGRSRQFDGTPLYEHPDPLLGEHPDWGTYVFNFGRSEVRNFLVANATYWLEEFHVDGLRVDAVASMLYLDYSRKPGQWRPNQYGGRENLDAISFLQEANATAYRRTPGIMMIAEESTAWPGVTAPTDGNGLGFGLKWNMGWMNDTLRYLAEEPVHRRYHHNEITFSMVYAYSERFVLPISHDEVVHGKGSLYERMPGDHWQKLAGVRLLLGYQWTHPGKQLLFMGSEFAQQTEWAESRSLDWHALDDPAHQGVMRSVADLNRVYKDTPALWQLDHSPDGFEWIDSDDAVPQHPRVPAQGVRRPAGRRRRQLRRHPARGVPPRPAPRRPVARDLQLRRRGLRRLRRRQPRRDRGPPRAALRPPVLRLDPRPPAGRRRLRGRLTSTPHATNSRSPHQSGAGSCTSTVELMSRVLVTGMSGAGKSTLLARWAARPPHRRHRPRRLAAARRHVGRAADGAAARRARRRRRSPAPSRTRAASTTASSTSILLTAPLDVLLARVATRTTNPYGSTRSGTRRDH